MAELRWAGAGAVTGDVRRLAVAQSLSLVGSGVNAAAVAYLVTTRSGVAAVGLVQTLPLVVAVAAAPLIGVLVDRRDARRTLVGTSAGLAALTVLLAGYGAFWYAVVLALRTPLEVAFSAALARALPALAAGDAVVRANGIMSATGRLATAAGVAVGPLLASLLGPAVFLLDAASFLVAAWLLAGLRVPPIRVAPARARLAGQFGEGLRYVWDRPAVLYVGLLYVLGGVAWGAKDTLFVGYVDQQLGLDPARWAGIYGATALVGEMVVASLIAAGRIGAPHRIPATVTVATAVLALSLVVTGTTRSPVLAFAMKFVEGAATNAVGVLAVTYVSLLAVGELRGRTKTLLTLGNRVSLGGAKAGLPALGAASTVGTSYVVAGVVVLAGIAAAVPLLRRRPTAKP